LLAYLPRAGLDD